MGVLKRLKDRLASPSVEDVHRERESPQNRREKNGYGGWVDNIYEKPNGWLHSWTWQCTSCGTEIYWKRDDDIFICHSCGEEYPLQLEGEFPDPLRAKCPYCKEVSGEHISARRRENMSFHCPHCGWRWKSSPY